MDPSLGFTGPGSPDPSRYSLQLVPRTLKLSHRSPGAFEQSLAHLFTTASSGSSSWCSAIKLVLPDGNLKLLTPFVSKSGPSYDRKVPELPSWIHAVVVVEVVRVVDEAAVVVVVTDVVVPVAVAVTVLIVVVVESAQRSPLKLPAHTHSKA